MVNACLIKNTFLVEYTRVCVNVCVIGVIYSNVSVYSEHCDRI